jgi:hypothetical protein
MAGEAAEAVARPFALRHPWLLVIGSAAVGAALVSSRPWRWVLRSTLLAGLAPQLASRLARSLPIESWMSTVSAMMSKPAARRAAPTNATTTATPPTTPTASTPPPTTAKPVSSPPVYAGATAP